MSHKRDMLDDDSPRSHKKPRQSNDSGTADSVPSLLSRLGSTNVTAVPQPSTSPTTSRAGNKNLPALKVPRQEQIDLDAPVGGWSILGAASRSQPSSPKPISRASSVSLLDRMKGVDIVPGNRERGSTRKRKRGGDR